MKLNIPQNNYLTHEGAPVQNVTYYERLKRTMMACMLFEDNFYEDGMKCVDRIKELCAKCTCAQVMLVAEEAATRYRLRHVPLQMIVEALKHKSKPAYIAQKIAFIIDRPDQMTDLLALYWKDGKTPLAHQLRKGLALAFTKFDRYQLSKYNRDNPIKLRDVMFLTHPKPKNDQQAKDWKDLVDGTLESPDTWEVRLSSGKDKKESFQELLERGKLGKLAILRNMRNMKKSGVPKELVQKELERNIKEMLPFQYLAAARECPEWEDILDKAMVESCAAKPKLPGMTFLLVDVSGSMTCQISNNSKMMRFDAACGMAILLRECCENVHIISFSDMVKTIPARRGMALRDAIVTSQPFSSTYLGKSISHVISANFDRMIVITDEQSSDPIPRMPKGTKNYILNIGNYQNGIGRNKDWTTISGFSEASIDFIRELETGDV